MGENLGISFIDDAEGCVVEVVSYAFAFARCYGAIEITCAAFSEHDRKEFLFAFARSAHDDECYRVKWVRSGKQN